MTDELNDLLALLDGDDTPDITEEEAGNTEIADKLRGEILTNESPVIVVAVIDEIKVVPEKVVENSKTECLRQITNILSEHGGLESNIPVTHQYWSLTNQYRNMQ